MKEPSQQSYWGRLAHTYDRDGEYVVGKPILRTISKRLSEEQFLGDVVEFGCGTGYLTRAIASQARHVVATDFCDEMLDVAEHQLRAFPNVTIQKADCASTAFPAGRFDCVFMANLIHVIEDPMPCLLESHRILRDGGLLIAVDFTGYRMRLIQKVKLVFRYVRRWGVPRRQERKGMSPEELASLIESAGFRIKDVRLMEDESNAVYVKGVQCAKPQST
jgi:ubiquinone/menaquinone biosynthesis C-methylase UbiE